MATVTRRCESTKCRRRFRVSAQSRRRYCEECRPPRVRAGALVDEAPVAPSTQIGPGLVEAAALAQLQAVDRHESVAGVLVLSLAQDIDRGALTAAQKGAAGQKLIALLAEALKGTARPRVAGPLDELMARRAAKAAAAS